MALAGCSSLIEFGRITSEEIAPNNFMGNWTVSDNYQSGPEDGVAPIALGQNVFLSENQARDAFGRICPTPHYQFTVAPRAQVLGYREREIANNAAAPTPIIQVFCGTEQPFLSMIALEDRMLLLADGARWLRLERPNATLTNSISSGEIVTPTSPTVSAPIAITASRAIPDAPIPAEAPIAESPAPDSGTNYLYLASYRNQETATRAWELFKQTAPALSAMQLVLKTLQISGRGEFIRVYAATDSDSQFHTICQQIHKLASDCGSSAMRWK